MPDATVLLPMLAACSKEALPGKDSGSVHATVKQLWLQGDAPTR